MWIVWTALLVLVPVGQDRHQSANDRGAMAMGFDQDKTAHHFLLYADGGAIDIEVRDASDATDREAIRSHLPHIATMFGSGDFAVPMLVHDSKDIPGVSVLSTRKDTVTYRYRETPYGGRVDIRTTDPASLAALHAFLRYQIHEHHTGDSGTVQQRQQGMDDWLGPRQLARASGVSTDTLRHYERLGLLCGTVRTASGYRRYPPGTVARVQVIRRALAIGFSLKELAGAFGQRARGGIPCQRVRALVGERLAALETRLRELAALRDEMRGLVQDWDVRLAATPKGQRARLLDMLAGYPALDTRALSGPARNRLHRER